MKRVLIIGTGNDVSAIIMHLHTADSVKIIAVIDKNNAAECLKLARTYNIPVGKDWRDWLNDNIDIVIDATGEDQVLKELHRFCKKETVVIPIAVANIIYELLEEKEALLDHLKIQLSKRESILDNIHDGMIVINDRGIIQFVNKRAEEIVGYSKSQFEQRDIRDVITKTRLPQVLRTRKKEVNQKLLLENGKNIITTRMPMINKANQLMGAFAVFKDITEVVNLAEENTDLKEIKTMLEAIIHCSEEAISVVDENGIGLMVNPAYTRITGLKETEIIGKPAATDISEGESMHMKVLQTRKPVRSVRMKVGSGKKDVLVNVAPIIVDGQIKGSVGVLHDVTEIKTLTSELKRARQIIRNLEAKYTFDDIIGSSPRMKLALEQARMGARTPATVLLLGDSGTGKELFAHAIHNESDRKQNKFIRVNCAAIAESLLESELFGYEEGAFSGAKLGGKKGLFEEANNGSIFLDEIGELSLSMQAKLLRVLQENEIVRVGGTNPITINARIITATNVNLERAIMNKTFREDLYYRLNRLPISIPSLNERLPDLPELIQHIIHKVNQDYSKNVTTITDDALQSLTKHHWPGNIRELENIIGRAMIYMDLNEEIIQRKHIPDLTLASDKLSQTVLQTDGRSLQEAVESYEKKFIADVYAEKNYNKTKTAKALRISIRNLYYKIDKYQLDKNCMQDFS